METFFLSAILPPTSPPFFFEDTETRPTPHFLASSHPEKKENSSGEKTIRQHVNLFSPPSATLQFNFMLLGIFCFHAKTTLITDDVSGEIWAFSNVK